MYINLDFGNLVLFLVIGLCAGLIANYLVGKKETSLLSSLLIGMAGALVGGLVLPALGFRFWGVVANFISATVGAVIIVVIARLFSSSKILK